MHQSFLILLCCCLPVLAAAENRPTTPADLEPIERLDKQVEKLGFGPPGPDHYALFRARIAEKIAYEAQGDIDACVSRKAQNAAAAMPPVSMPTIERIIVEKHTLATDSLFAFDRSGIEFLVQGGCQKLDALADELKTWKSLERIELSGHTDRLGPDTYNQTLSGARAEQIRQHLASRGIPLNLIESRGQGETDPVVQCTAQRSRSALIECLQPNRRVELLIQGVRQ